MQKNGFSNEDALTSEDVKAYIKLPYKRVIYPTGENGNNAFFGYIMEIDGCYVDAQSYDEAYEKLSESLAAHIDMFLKNGLTPPRPILPEDFNGKVLVRMPKTLHFRLSIEAIQEKVSLNHLIVSKLSSAVS